MTDKILNSTDSLLVITEFLSPQAVLQWNALNHKFYDKIVPQIMAKRKLLP